MRNETTFQATLADARRGYRRGFNFRRSLVSVANFLFESLVTGLGLFIEISYRVAYFLVAFTSVVVGYVFDKVNGYR